ncbi:hypothetical protein [Krasilnikovia sp. MM14-A1004]|uniref:hypothetical protein n=1 Tax=Krasilnikovia sp. MM14-A1004 TaxID=3373541 RepID=UPI00399CD86C
MFRAAATSSALLGVFGTPLQVSLARTIYNPRLGEPARSTARWDWPPKTVKNIHRVVHRGVAILSCHLAGLHDIRHTYATVSLDGGVVPKVVADRMGHATMAHTLSIYTRRSTSRDRQAAEKVAGMIFGDGWSPPDSDDETA